MARFGRYLELARGATPTEHLVFCRSIHGRSLELGDGSYSDGSGGSPYDASGGIAAGWRFNFLDYRTRVVIDIPLVAEVLAGAEIVSAIHHLPIAAFNWTPFSGEHVLGFHLLRVPVDETDAIWDEYDDSANLDWGHPGGQTGVDHDTTPVDTLLINTTLYNACASSTANNAHFETLDVTAAVREASEKAWTGVQLFAVPQWDGSGLTRMILIQEGGLTHDAVAHAFTAIDYLPPLSWFGLNADGSIGYGRFLDHAVADRDARVLTGNPTPGGTGPTRPVAIANATVNDLTEIVIIKARAFAEAVSRPSGRRYPRHVQVFDDATGEGYIDGSTRMEPVPSFESTRYRAYVTPAFGTEDPTPLVTALGNSYGHYDRDETFLYDGDDAFIIRTEWWGLSPAAVVGDEQWIFKHKKDARPSGYTQEAAEAHEITQHSGLHDSGVTFNRALADPDKWRDVWNATLQQCTGASRVASQTTAGYGTLDRTHVSVGSVEEFLVGSPCTIWDTDHVEHAIIDGTIARTDATYPDQLFFERELDWTYGADAKVATGLYIGELGARDRTSLAIVALAGQNYLELAEPLRAATGSLKIHSLTSDVVETHAFTVSGSRANFTDASITSIEFAVGSLITVVETLSWCPVFFRLKPEEGAAEVEQLSLVRAIRSGTR